MSVASAAPVEAPDLVDGVDRSAVRSALLRRLGRSLSSLLISVAVVLVLWEGFILVFHIQAVVARNPLEVWRYLFSQHANSTTGLRSAAGNRAVLFKNLKITLRDAGIGYLAGIVFALAVACVFILQRAVQQTFMPIAIVLRSMPLVAMAPLITLIFGRGLVAVAVIGGIVCFFPALVNIVQGLRSTPEPMLDLMRAYGASRFTTLRKVLLPSALPSIFAALRINVPASVIGALLAEWLATGQGSGQEMLTVENTFDYGELWSAVVLVTLVSIVGYSIMSAVEAGVLARYAPDRVGPRR